MTDRAQTIQRAILATATAYAVLDHGSAARSICRERLQLLMSLHAQGSALPDLAAPSDIGTVVTAAARVAGTFGTSEAMGDPEHILRAALRRYFTGQSQKLAADLRLVEAVP